MSSVINTAETHGLFHIIKLNNEQKTILKGRNSKMKKFLTVLLVIAVMFTFSFSSAFAAVDWTGETASKYLTEAGDYDLASDISSGTKGTGFFMD